MPVPDHDVQAHGAPRLLLHRRQDLAAQFIIAGSRLRCAAGQIGDGLQQVGTRHDSDQRVAAEHGQALDALLLHNLHNVLEGLLLGGRVRDHELVAAHALYWYVLAVAFAAVWFVVYVTK